MTMCRSLAWLGGGILFGSVYPPSKMIDFPSGDQSWAMLPAVGGRKELPVCAAGGCGPQEKLFLGDVGLGWGRKSRCWGGQPVSLPFFHLYGGLCTPLI